MGTLNESVFLPVLGLALFGLYHWPYPSGHALNQISTNLLWYYLPFHLHLVPKLMHTSRRDLVFIELPLEVLPQILNFLNFKFKFIVLVLCACYTSTLEINYHFTYPTLVFFSREWLVTLLILVVGGCSVVWHGFLVAPRGSLMPQRAVVSYRQLGSCTTSAIVS